MELSHEHDAICITGRFALQLDNRFRDWWGYRFAHHLCSRREGDYFPGWSRSSSRRCHQHACRLPAGIGAQVKLALIATLALAGCQALGLASPKGFDQQLAEAYGVHTAVVSATTVAVSAGTISSAEAAQVQTQALSARTLLDTAKSVETSNPTAAANDLALATAALTALQTYLNSRTHP
jgi:hypothetical protein